MCATDCEFGLLADFVFGYGQTTRLVVDNRTLNAAGIG